MTVRELAESLRDKPPDAQVVFGPDYEWGEYYLVRGVRTDSLSPCKSAPDVWERTPGGKGLEVVTLRADTVQPAK